MRTLPSDRWSLPSSGLAWLAGLALLLSADTSPAVLLSDATSITTLMCVSVAEPNVPIAAPVDYSCDGLWFDPIRDQSGPSRAFATTGFGDPLTVSVRVETTGAPQQISSHASSRIKFQLAVGQMETPPMQVGTVPVKITTAGRIAVAPLAGLLAGGGISVGSTDSIPFTNVDVFAHAMHTQFPHVEVDEYDIVETIDLHPEQVYYGNLYAGCNFAIQGTSACEGNASVSFVLDQAAFDAQMGANSFDLSHYFAVQRSPNFVPEPSSEWLGMAAVIGLAMIRRRRA